MTALGAKIRDLRGPRTVTDIATQLGVSPTYLFDIERGSKRGWRDQRLDKLAEVLGCHPIELRKATWEDDGGYFVPIANVPPEERAHIERLALGLQEQNHG